MQNHIETRFDATACARSRCFECNIRMESMLSFGEATGLWILQSVWILRGNTVWGCHDRAVSFAADMLIQELKSVCEWQQQVHISSYIANWLIGWFSTVLFPLEARMWAHSVMSVPIWSWLMQCFHVSLTLELVCSGDRGCSRWWKDKLRRGQWQWCSLYRRSW